MVFYALWYSLFNFIQHFFSIYCRYLTHKYFPNKNVISFAINKIVFFLNTKKLLRKVYGKIFHSGTGYFTSLLGGLFMAVLSDKLWRIVRISLNKIYLPIIFFILSGLSILIEFVTILLTLLRCNYNVLHGKYFESLTNYYQC